MACFDSLDFIVRDAADGLLLSRPDLHVLDGGSPQEVIVAQRALSTEKVAVVSGGGAGHEPAHVALVGAGLLSIAVSGSVFASPSSSAVLRAIRHAAATTRAGVLVVIKNYTGDRLTFGIAVESARADGLCVDTVLVADDAVVQGGIGGRRGLAGTLFVHKVAGALADAGKPLSVVAECARAVAGSVATAGAAYSGCHVPGTELKESAAIVRERDHGGIEFGMGIHGEPGAQVLPAGLGASGLARALAVSAAAHAARASGCTTLPVGSEVAVLVNNLGGLSQLELCVFVRATVQALTQPIMASAEGGDAAPSGLGLRIVRLYSGSLLTSLDMRGVSVSLLPICLPSWPRGAKLSVVECLDAATQVPAWEAAAWHHTHSADRIPAMSGSLPGIILGPREPRSAGMPQHAQEPAEVSHSAADSVDSIAGAFALATRTVFAAFTAAAESMVHSHAILNALDAIAGDGDAGTTAALIGRACMQAIPTARGAAAAHACGSDSAAPALLEELLRAAGAAVADAAGGTSGALYAIMMSAAASAMRTEREHASSTPDHSGTQTIPTMDRLCLAALSAAVAAVSQYGGATSGDRTLLDALAPAQAELASSLCASAGNSGRTPGDIAMRVAAAAARGRDATAAMPRARAGRAAYVREDVLVGHADPGAAGVALWMSAIAAALQASD